MKPDWENVRKPLKPVEYLVLLLNMTTSLCELAIIEPLPLIRAPGDDTEATFVVGILERALDPLFLPLLTKLKFPQHLHLIPLCRGRLLERISCGVRYGPNELPVHPSADPSSDWDPLSRTTMYCLELRGI
jgi:hypothetical protein